jgi:hypothetical protein
VCERERERERERKRIQRHLLAQVDELNPLCEWEDKFKSSFKLKKCPLIYGMKIV